MRFCMVCNVFFVGEIPKSVVQIGRWNISQSGKTKMVALQLKYESNWTESYFYVNHLFRPFFSESLRDFFFSRPKYDSRYL